jgi:hypothetical protein
MTNQKFAVNLSISGLWRVTLDYGDRVERTAWTPNQLQLPSAPLVAALLSGTPVLSGITHMGFGSGENSWDVTNPERPQSQLGLTSEVLRKPLDGVPFYLDPSFDPVAGPEVTRRVRFRSVMEQIEGNGETFREFGLFGGDATSDLNSGYMFNWIRHGRIDKTSAFRVIREVTLVVRTVPTDVDP